MKNGILSRSDVVEVMASSIRPCRWWRAYFKRYGWKWDVIWKQAAKEHYIDLKIAGEEAGGPLGGTAPLV